jgi:hypothetical protein
MKSQAWVNLPQRTWRKEKTKAKREKKPKEDQRKQK